MALSNKAQKPEGSLTDNVLTPGQIVGSSNVGELRLDPKLLIMQRTYILTYICWSQKITE